MSILQILIIIFAPYFLTKQTYRLGTQKWLSPVVLSYGIGIIIGNIPGFSELHEVPHLASQATLLLAIPLLLFSTDLIGWFKYAKSTLLSFSLCVFSGVGIALTMAFIFQDKTSEIWVPAGMLTGIFTGGAPNLNAVGIALNAPEDLIVTLNAMDIICGGLLLIFLTSIAHSIYGKILPHFDHSLNNEATSGAIFSKASILDILFLKTNKNSLFKSFGLTILILLATIGITLLITGELKSQILVILCLTTFSVLASLSPNIRNLKGSWELGEYFLYMFCVAIGMLADVSSIFEQGSFYLVFTACIMYGTHLLHLIFARIFKIDRDTMMITSTAALYGPAFVGQIASAINNRTLILSGMATGLVGYAIGNFLGIGVAELLKLWIGG